MKEIESVVPAQPAIDPLDYPENYLWVQHDNYLIDGARLYDLQRGATPTTEVEQLLVSDPEWLRIYLTHCLGEWPITIPPGGPLPSWDEEWLRAIGETDEQLSEDEAAALRRRTDPALAWEIDDAEGAAMLPGWVAKPK